MQSINHLDVLNIIQFCLPNIIQMQTAILKRYPRKRKKILFCPDFENDIVFFFKKNYYEAQSNWLRERVASYPMIVDHSLCCVLVLFINKKISGRNAISNFRQNLEHKQ